MKRYMLLPEDSIELLRAQDEAEAAVCVSEKSQIFVFPARHFLFIIEMLQRRSKSEVMKS